MLESKIVTKIIEGMISSLSDAMYLSENFSAIVKTEYLITVNIAQKISELGPLRGSERICTFLEVKTKEFASSCVPIFKKTVNPLNNLPSTLLRKFKNTGRNGRIDIAVYCSGSSLLNKAVCAIEVKGFNPSRNYVIKDLERNAEYFGLYCKTGRSIIEFTAFCAFYSFGNSYESSHIQRDFQCVDAIYKQYMKSIKLPLGVEYEIKIFTASKCILSGGETQEHYDEVCHQLHHHVGVAVIFRWKSGCSTGECLQAAVVKNRLI